MQGRGATRRVPWCAGPSSRPCPFAPRFDPNRPHAMTLPWNQRPLSGCLFESASLDVPDARLGAAPGAALPSLVDLRAHCSPVEDQRLTNSCTANAAVGALEYHQKRAGQPVTDLSRLFVYYNARQLAGMEAKDIGSFIHHVMAAILAHGACEERLWPFQEAMCTTKPVVDAYRDAQRFQAVQYARTPLGGAVKAALAGGLPVVFGTYLPRRFYEEAATGGVMPPPAEHVEAPGSGHAMLLVGYDDAREAWLARNSWGPTWAEGGYAWIPYATLARYSDPTHFWTIGAIDRTPTLQMLVRGGAEAPLGERPRAAAALDLDRIRRTAQAMGGDLDERLGRDRASLRDRLRGS